MSDINDRNLPESATKVAGIIPQIVIAVSTTIIAAVCLVVLFSVSPMKWAWEMEVRTAVIEAKLDSTNETLSKLVETVDKMTGNMLDLQIRVTTLDERVADLIEGQKKLLTGQKELVGRFDGLEASIAILLTNSNQSQPSSLSIANQQNPSGSHKQE